MSLHDSTLPEIEIVAEVAVNGDDSETLLDEDRVVTTRDEALLLLSRGPSQ